MSELPKSWAATTLGNVSQDCAQRIPADDELFQYIDIASIDRDKKTVTSPQVLLGKDAPSRARKHVAESDVLVSMTRPNLNAVALVPKPLNGQIASTGFDVLRATEIDPRWIFYTVRSANFVERMCELVQGALYPAVRGKDIRGYEIPLAPLPEQKRIADKLDSTLARVEACRDRLDRLPALLKRFRQSILAAATSGRLTDDLRQHGAQGDAQSELDAWLKTRSLSEKKQPADPDLSHWELETPLGWTVCSVQQFAECLDRLRVPIKRELRKNTSGLYPYYGANGEVGKIDEYIFDDELVLVTEDETFYGREKPIAYRSSGKCWVNNHAHVLRAKTKAANDYLCYALMYYNVIPWLSGTTGRAKLTQQALTALPIACPPEREMVEIIRRVETRLAFADRLEARLATARKQAEQLTPALLAKAFRGELVPQEPDDEPASELLKRLAASRTDAPKPRRGRKAAA